MSFPTFSGRIALRFSRNKAIIILLWKTWYFSKSIFSSKSFFSSSFFLSFWKSLSKVDRLSFLTHISIFQKKK